MGAGLFAVLLLFAFVPATPAADLDADGMPDSYEVFFQLDPADATDALLDDDGDSVTNAAEAALGTDPWASDSDRDGFSDGADSNALSRAFIAWGEPFYTFTNDYLYVGPSWWIGSWQEGGAWQTNPVAWHAPLSLSNGIGSLYIAVDREILTNDAVLELDYLGVSNATLYLDLLDTNELAIVTNLFGNLLIAQGEDGHTNLALPLAANAEAAVILMRRGEGDVTVYGNMLYVDQDGDGLDADQEAQLETSDHDADSDGDGLSDYAEAIIHGTHPTQSDTDADGVNDGEEVARGTDPGDPESTNTTVFADAVAGDDANDGFAAIAVGGHGPKETLAGALGVARDGDTLRVAPGRYSAADFRTRDVTVFIGDAVIE